MSPELSKVLERVQFQGMPLSALTEAERSLYRRYQLRTTALMALATTLWYVFLSGFSPLDLIMWLGYLPILEPLFSAYGRGEMTEEEFWNWRWDLTD